ncbi:hypothetical protein, partial [Haemophilus parainfluenzae]|uniref:hypothetical protein n=1 Tax=Haemophilus parainfluenzae TaxID=729 RepID=UPI001788BDE4
QYYQYGNGAGSGGTVSGTPNDTVDITTGGGTAYNNGVAVYAAPKDAALKGYAGAVYTLLDIGGNATTTAVFCEGTVAG